MSEELVVDVGQAVYVGQHVSMNVHVVEGNRSASSVRLACSSGEMFCDAVSVVNCKLLRQT